MAIFKSAIVYKTGEVIGLPTTDHHETIIDYLGLADTDDGKERNWVRVEYYPKNESEPWRWKTYALRLDESYIENFEWFKDIQPAVIEKMEVLAKRQVIEGTVNELRYGEFWLAPGAAVRQIEHCTIYRAKDAKIGNVQSSTFYGIQNCTFNAVQDCILKYGIVNSTFNDITQSQVASLQKCTIQRITSSLIYSVDAETKINSVLGNCLFYDVYGTILSSAMNSRTVFVINALKGSKVPDGLTRPKFSQKDFDDVKIARELAELNLGRLTLQVQKLTGKMPRLRKTSSVKKKEEPAVVLTGKAKFPEYDTRSDHGNCLVCGWSWMNNHQDYACRGRDGINDPCAVNEYGSSLWEGVP